MLNNDHYFGDVLTNNVDFPWRFQKKPCSVRILRSTGYVLSIVLRSRNEA